MVPVGARCPVVRRVGLLHPRRAAFTRRRRVHAVDSRRGEARSARTMARTARPRRPAFVEPRPDGLARRPKLPLKNTSPRITRAHGQPRCAASTSSPSKKRGARRSHSETLAKAHSRWVAGRRVPRTRRASPRLSRPRPTFNTPSIVVPVAAFRRASPSLASRTPSFLPGLGNLLLMAPSGSATRWFVTPWTVNNPLNGCSGWWRPSPFNHSRMASRSISCRAITSAAAILGCGQMNSSAMAFSATLCFFSGSRLRSRPRAGALLRGWPWLRLQAGWPRSLRRGGARSHDQQRVRYVVDVMRPGCLS